MLWHVILLSQTKYSDTYAVDLMKAMTMCKFVDKQNEKMM